MKVEVANFCAAMDTLIDQDACLAEPLAAEEVDLGVRPG